MTAYINATLNEKTLEALYTSINEGTKIIL